MSDLVYKVLWVDDEVDLVDGLQQKADNYNIVLNHFTNWQQAEQALRKNFQDYSAIILDANCKVNADSIEQEEFITAVLPSLLAIFGEKRQLIPWYILSAGTMSNFESIVKGAKYQHATHESEWGEMLYLKDALDDSPQSSSKLFENIQLIAKESANNIILYRHSDVFAYLGEDKLIDSRARVLLLKMLSALYNPEENIKYEYVGNPLRKVLEYVFRAARKMGLLAEECFDNKDSIVLLDASRYMAGNTINWYNGREVKGEIRWGKAGNGNYGSGGDAIFTQEIAMLVKNTINYTSSDSHTEEETPYFIDEENKEIFFSYVMQVCYVIKWFGKYVSEHSDVEKNRLMKQIIPNETGKKNSAKTNPVPLKMTKENPIGKRFLVQKVDGLSVCGSSKLSDELQHITGQVVIEDVIDNPGTDKDVYPYIITKIKS